MSEILIIESASKYPSIGIFKHSEFIISNSGKEGNHSVFFFEFLRKINLNNIDKIIITIGPGRFTSLRVGLSLALGLAIPRNIKIIPLNTFETIENKLIKKYDDFGIFLKKGGEGFLFKRKGDKDIKIVKELPEDLKLFTFEPYNFNFDFNIIVLDPIMMFEYYSEKKEALIETTEYEKIKPLYSFLPYEKSLIEKGKIKGFT